MSQLSQLKRVIDIFRSCMDLDDEDPVHLIGRVADHLSEWVYGEIYSEVENSSIPSWSGSIDNEEVVCLEKDLIGLLVHAGIQHCTSRQLALMIMTWATGAAVYAQYSRSSEAITIGARLIQCELHREIVGA